MVLSATTRLADGGGACGVLVLDGEIDVATYPLLRSALDELTTTGVTRVVVDLAGVSYCDSTGIGVLATGAKRLLDAGGRLEVAGVRPDVAEILHIAGLSAVVPSFPTVELALAVGPAA